MDRAVVLVSGGVNSAVALAASREQYSTALLHISWGHRTADREREAFNQLAEHYQGDQVMVADLSCMAAFGGNSRTSKRATIEDATALGGSVPFTFVQGLLPTLLSVAATWAASLKARRIILGISENHAVPGPVISDLYPDHSRLFVQAFNLMLQYAKPAERDILVEAPLIDLTRCEIVKLGTRMDVPFEKTWSCYSQSGKPCTRCRACTTRFAGFIQAGVPDPILPQPAEV